MRILLAGNDAINRHEVIVANGHTVYHAKDLDEIEFQVRAVPMDVMILDLESMAGGLERLNSWRQRGVPFDILVLARSGIEATRALSAGADVAVAKPCADAELLARLRALWRRDVHYSQKKVLRMFDLEIDPVGRRVTRAGRSIHLTPSEFQLLRILARHQGQTVSRESLSQIFHQRVTEGRSNIVDVYVFHLRRKIDRDFALPLILTVWSEGYQFRAEPKAKPRTANPITYAARSLPRHACLADTRCKSLPLPTAAPTTELFDVGI